MGKERSEKMNPTSRLLTAIRCEQPDRVPIHIRGVPAWNEDWVVSQDVSYSPLIKMVREECDMFAYWNAWDDEIESFLTDIDVADIDFKENNRDEGEWIINEKIVRTKLGPISLVKHVSKKDYPSLVKKYWIESEDDLSRFFSIPYFPFRPDVGKFFEISRKVDGIGLPIVGLLSPIGCVYNLLGSELLCLWSKEKRGVILRLLEMFRERLMDMITYLLNCNIRGIYSLIGQEYTAPPLMSPLDFHEFVTEIEPQIVEKLHREGCLVHVHCHGRLNAILGDFLFIGINCLHPIEPPPLGDVNLSDAKERIGKHVCLEGNIQIGDLYTCETQEIQDKVKFAIDSAGKGGGFILAPSASIYSRQLHPKALKNYLTMIETGLSYGKY